MALVAAGTAGASGISGDAAGYNVFIFGSGSFVSQNTDTMGNLAVGGDVSLQNYAVAQGIAGNPAQNPNPARLVVGGTLTAQNGGVGSNQQGAIYTDNTPTLTSFTAGGGVQAQTLIANFGVDAALYQNSSSAWGAQAQNGSVSLMGSTLTLSGSVNGLNVFNITGDQLTNSNTINISAPTGATVLVNVSGGSAIFQNGSVFETGIDSSSVLYNFFEATSVNLAGSKNPMGSILAPLAGVTGGYGALDGQLIAGSYIGNTQFNDVQFTGTLPAAVPLPAAAWLMLSSLGGLITLGRKRRQ